MDPTSGESFCSYISHVDGECLQAFLRELGEAYPEEHLVAVMDNAPSHRCGAIALPENMSLLKHPSYSPELNPVEMVFGVQANPLQQALNRVLERY